MSQYVTICYNVNIVPNCGHGKLSPIIDLTLGWGILVGLVQSASLGQKYERFLVLANKG